MLVANIPETRVKVTGQTTRTVKDALSNSFGIDSQSHDLAAEQQYQRHLRIPSPKSSLASFPDCDRQGKLSTDPYTAFALLKCQ